MPWQIYYTQKALDELSKLSKKTAKRILDKVSFFGSQQNPLSFAKKLTNPVYGTYCFRVGDYRVIFDVDNKGKITILLVLSVKHRLEVYRF